MITNITDLLMEEKHLNVMLVCPADRIASIDSLEIKLDRITKIKVILSWVIKIKRDDFFVWNKEQVGVPIS